MKKSLSFALALLLVLCVSPAFSAQAAPPEDGLVLALSFEENVTAAGSLGAQATLTGTLKYAEGAKGKAALFDGTQQIALANTGTLESITLSYWFNMPNLRAGEKATSAIFTTTDWNDGSLHTHMYDGEIVIGVKGWKDDTRTDANQHKMAYKLGDALKGKWVNAIFTFDAATQTRRFYVNGTLMDESTGAMPENLLKGEWQIGAWRQEEARNWQGMLDEIRLYNRALSKEEIALLAAEGNAEQLPAPTAVQATEKPTQKPTATVKPTAQSTATAPVPGTATVAPGVTKTPAAVADSGWILYAAIGAVVAAGAVVALTLRKKKK